MSEPPPFAYRLDHRDGESTVTLARAADYGAAVELVERWAAELRRQGAGGSLLVIEEAFGTTVARYALDPKEPPFDPGHVNRPREAP